MDETSAGVRLPRFPAGAARVRLYRWLARRRVVTGIGWYVGVLIPVLVLTVVAARANDTLGQVTLVVGGVAAVVALLRLRRTVTNCHALAERVATVRDTHLVVGPDTRLDLHAGRTAALDPGAVRGYGRAHLLAVDGRPSLLLSDPLTSEPRAAGDLRPLVDTLRTSPHQADRQSAHMVSLLSVPRTGSEPGREQAPAGTPPLVWRVVDALAWTILVAAVVPGVLLAGGALVPDAPGQRTGVTGQLLGLIGMALVLIWVISVFANVSMWIGTTWLAFVRRGRSERPREDLPPTADGGRL